MNIYLINTETNEWPIYEYEFLHRNSGNSYPSPLINPPEPYFWVSETAEPEYDKVRQKVVEIAPKNIDGQWTQQWEIVELSQSEISANEELERIKNKNTAEIALAQSDWVEVPSVTNTEKRLHLINANEWDAYRDALREIAVNPPIVVETWPTKPEERWSV